MYNQRGGGEEERGGVASRSNNLGFPRNRIRTWHTYLPASDVPPPPPQLCSSSYGTALDYTAVWPRQPAALLLLHVLRTWKTHAYAQVCAHTPKARRSADPHRSRQHSGGTNIVEYTILMFFFSTRRKEQRQHEEAKPSQAKSPPFPVSVSLRLFSPPLPPFAATHGMRKTAPTA